MKRLQSRYESLIRVKEQSEQIAQLQQTAAKKQLDKVTADLRLLENQLAAVTLELEERMGEQVQASHFQHDREYIGRLQREIEQVQQAAASMKAALLKTTVNRIDLSKEVETLRCVREGELRVLRKSNEQSSQRDSDDHAVRQWSASVTSSKER